MRVLAIDPGREKCGLAVVDSRDGVLARGVVPTAVTPTLARDWVQAHRARALLIGSGTSSREMRPVLQEIGLPVHVVPERDTTLRARARYFREHPPRGWRRLVFRAFPGLIVPPEPVDDYAAVLIAESFLAAPAEPEQENAVGRQKAKGKR